MRHLSVENVFQRFETSDCKPARTPAALNLKLEKATPQSSKAQAIIYRSLIGALLRLANQTRPEIMWITNEPTTDHYSAEKRVLRCLRYSKDFKFTFPQDIDFEIFGESQAD